MLRMPIYINDRRIANLGIHNTGEIVDGVTKYHVYDLRKRDDGETLADIEAVETVHHDRDDGASKLVERVMETVDEQQHFE